MLVCSLLHVISNGEGAFLLVASSRMLSSVSSAKTHLWLSSWYWLDSPIVGSLMLMIPALMAG